MIQVTGIRAIAAGGCVITTPGGAQPGKVAKTDGISNGAKIAIAVVAVGGAAGGIVAATGRNKSR